MINLFLKKVASTFVVLATLATLVPSTVFAASLSAPRNVEIIGGEYTNDATPTVTWDRPSGATWYEIAVDAGGVVALGNVDSHTLTTLGNGWHTFYIWAHDNSGNKSATTSLTFEIDTVGPTVPAVSPSSATEGEAVTFSVYPYGEAAPTSCVLYVDGSSAGTMSKNGSTFTKSYTFTWDGTYTVYARCTDGDGNITSGSSRTVTVNNEGDEDEDEEFVVPAVSPSSAVEDESTTFRVTPYGDLDAETCKLYVSGSNVGTMSESSGTFSKSYTFSNDGTYTVYAYCEDENGDWTWGTSRNVSVEEYDENNDESPTVPAVTPSSATEDEEVEISVDPSSDEDVEWCDLYVDGDNVGDMDRESDGEFTIDYTFKNSGSYTVYATCTDESYDVTRGTSRTITVGDEDEDEEFVVPAVTPSSATEDEEVTFEVTPYGDLDAETCKLYVSGSNVGTMSEDDGEFTRGYTFSNNGSYTVYAYCEDENGDWVKGTSRTVKVDNEDDTDEDFTVPAVTPSSADEDEEVTFEVEPYGDLDAETCKLYVNGSNKGTMSEDDGEFTLDYTFTNDGDYTVYAYCEDENGDWTKGTSRTVGVDDEKNDDEDEDDEAERGSLIKTDCGTSTDVADPCRAVYYYDEHGDRHAFPNESTFYSWFADFDDVVEVSDDFMASLELGDNVTYRPGSVLVKFDTSSKVYAVEEKNTLRHYESTSALEADYGDDWEEVLVSLPDTLYKNYKIGNEIDSKSDFDRTDAYYSVDSIEDIF